MNHLLAKTSGRNGDFYKLISDTNIFELPDSVTSSTSYNADYNLDEDEWFAVENFSEQDYCIPILQRDFNSTDYNRLPALNNSFIGFLTFYNSDENNYYFQKVNKRHIISARMFSLTNLEMVNENKVLVINEDPDAIYVKSNDKFYFKNISKLTTIFKGIDTLFKEATDAETESFLEHSFLNLGEDFDHTKVKTANRKRIALVTEKLSNLNESQKQQIFNYIGDYNSDLVFDNGTFDITNEEELKQLLYGIDERYYTTAVSNEKRLANSVKAIG